MRSEEDMMQTLTPEQLESLRQAANEEKMRPGQQGFEVDDWRNIPTSQEELDSMPPDDREYWLDVADRF